jgi:hypothetical protein
MNAIGKDDRKPMAFEPAKHQNAPDDPVSVFENKSMNYKVDDWDKYKYGLIVVPGYTPLVQVFPISPQDITLVHGLMTCTHYPCVFKTHKYAHWCGKSTNSMRVFRKNQYFNAKTLCRVTAS